MIDVEKLISNIDAFNAVCAKNELQQCKTAIERFDLAIKVIESHRSDIENAGKVLKHWGMHTMTVKVYRPRVYGDQPQRVAFSYDELDGGELRCGYTTGNIGWLSDGSIKIGHSWSMKIDDVRVGIPHGLDGKVIDGYDISYRHVVNALFKLARMYPEAEEGFVDYFETLGK